MSFGYYMNIEKLAIEVAEEHIKLMEENIQDEKCSEFLNLEKMINNIKNGFVVIVQEITFMEGFLNTIIHNCMNNNSNLFLRMSIEEKVDLICLYYRIKPSEIKSMHYWETFKKINKVRNELVHFKKSFIKDCTAITDFNIAEQSVRKFFIKSNMRDTLNQTIKLGDCIADKLGLKINKNIDIIACDAKDGLVNYVYNV